MTASGKKKRAPRNRTIELSSDDRKRLSRNLLGIGDLEKCGGFRDALIQADALDTLSLLPANSYDLLFADPPYNLNKSFGNNRFKALSQEGYEAFVDEWLTLAIPLLKETASVYICGDWRSSAAIQNAGSKHLILRNRITWEREKGRGSRANWKSSSEDIWFFTVSDKYTFNPEAVKLKRKVIAPYTENGKPKDWEEGSEGRVRLTHPSNLWTDLTVPFWSMPENTDHPTQKPEKLLAKLILASTNEGDVLLDPFMGAGTSAAAARKLDRGFTGIEIEKEYCLLAAKRLEMAKEDRRIQGIEDGVFWERNARP